MIKTILFDFDGVILDSMKIKAEGFKSIFSAFSDDAIEKIEAYHYANGGVSRFEKIKYFFNVILQKKVGNEDIQRYAQNFADAINLNLKNPNNLIMETVEFIQANSEKFNMHIVSGAEHDELNEICDHFHLSAYFLSIEGSPVVKSMLIATILKDYGYQEQETILIGDSINDFESATQNNIEFIGYNNPELRKSTGLYVESFQQLNL